MDWKSEWKKLAWVVAVFLGCFYLPAGLARFDRALLEAAHLVKWYAREHVLLCLIPAFFIAGAIGVFVSQAAVMKYLGPAAKKIVAYGVASASGSILAVCSCTILPLFTGIYKMGAGLGPACAFLYSGPAINVLAMIMTARILGPELG
ncbi:MAG: permease, partial [Kiritimatiellae bacterium]|nr:permease [Kiritimatiellia bacterium]